MKTLNEHIGEKLKEARLNSGLTLKQVGERVNRNHSTISTYESGTRAINVDMMEELCNIYNVNFVDILQEIYYTRKIKGETSDL